MDFLYLITPFVTWLVTGCTKFGVNCLREKRLAFDLVGYGGMPSNHSAIISSAATMVALREGINHPAFGVAVAIALLVIFDATSLRRKVGKQAEAINRLSAKLAAQMGEEPPKPLRERAGHTPTEVLAGIAMGSLTAWALLRLVA